ncbi:hypothetical protein [Mesorhizobium sp. L-8-3]|uniref:hypothetical protein n=1 Tax=Mesorhizobium sp. L-8-3 TaxID=2744522 RepID=UPI00192546C2|nr:hypothetical protein [Mesorhizobium sp. L-8-3]BCH22500.1 hypothetical protein MesoLjLb_22850 [Mesorhizobium sp. L-8-3]
MDMKGILGHLEAKLSDGVNVSKEYLSKGADVTKHAARELSGFNQMAREADEITRSLGLVYRE